MLAASGDEEKQDPGEETTSLLDLKEEIGNQKAHVEALLQIEVKSHKNELQSLRAHADNTNNVLCPTSNSAVKQDSDTDQDDLLYEQPSDIFNSIMMVYPPLTPAWNIGIFSFTLQMLLLIMIWISQVSEGDESTPFNVPLLKVNRAVRIGPVVVILVCVLSQQDDVVTSLQSICAFLWKCDCTAASQQLFASGHDLLIDHDDSPILATVDARSSRDRKFYASQIILQNLLKFGQGVFVLLVSLIIIVQGMDLIDLLTKDSTPLFFVSAIGMVMITIECGFDECDSLE